MLGRKSQKWFNNKYSKNLTELKISNKDFDSPLKIDGFTKLETIDLKKFKLTSLEISSCAKLNEDIKLSGCQIKSLSVNECRKLDCSHSDLTEIEISNLTELDCSSNKINYLNLNLCPEVTTVVCSNNKLDILEI